MKQLIIKAFVSVTSTSNTSQFTDQWICDEGWFQILMRHIPYLKDALNINRASAIRSISSVAVPLSNKGENLIYHKTFQMECPYATPKRCHVHFSIAAQMQECQVIQRPHHNVLMLSMLSLISLFFDLHEFM